MATFHYQGFDIHYTIEGEGKSIVFLHGVGGGSLNWLHQRNHFKKNYQVIAIDFPGHGSSEGGDELGFYDYHAMLKTLIIDELGLDEIILCGISMGGKAAMDFASRYPDTVRGLLLAATFAEMGEADKRKRKAVWDLILEPGGGEKWVKEVTVQMGLDPQGAIARGFEKSLENISLEFMYKLYIQFLNYEQNDQLDVIDVPALIVHGDRDDFVPMSCAKEMYERLVHSELEVLSDCGHLPNVEKPQQFNELLDQFAHRVFSNPF